MPAIGQEEGIFTCSGILLVKRREFAHVLAFYWSRGGNILMLRHLSGQEEGVFSCSGILLVKRREYSDVLASYWSRGGNILMLWHLIGHEGIF